MRQKNLNPSIDRKRNQRGQALVETALVLLLFLTTLIAALDFSQLLFSQQMLVERVRSGLRWGMIHPWDGTGDQIANMILYKQSAAKEGAGFLGLTRANILVTYAPPTVADPNDVRLTVAIINYKFQFFTPFIARSFVNNRAIVESAPILYR